MDKKGVLRARGWRLAWVSGLGPNSWNGLGGAPSLAEVGEDLVLVGPVEDHKALWRKDGTSILFYLAHQQITGSWETGERD